MREKFNISKFLKSKFSSKEGLSAKEGLGAEKKSSFAFFVSGVVLKFIAVIGAAFMFAQMASVVCIPFMMGLFSLDVQSGGRPVEVQQYKLSSRPNFHTLVKNILGRNLFNANGEFPVEEEIVENSYEEVSDFDLSGPCRESKIKNVQLVGTIFMPSRERNSIAIVQEKGVDSADLYKMGDFIIGQDNAQVVKILKDEVILNNSGIKECLKLNVVKFKSFVNGKNLDKKAFVAGANSGNSTDVVVESDFVRSQLGDSFSKIISSARLVPNISGSSSSGFKIFAISRGSLFDKIGLRNGDVITQVNETIMEAQEGFALYKAFEDEQYIRISLLRKGKTPTTIMVQIK